MSSTTSKSAPTKPQPAANAFDLLETATAVAKATRLKDAKAIITSDSGREARILIPVEGKDVTLAFLRTTTKGIRVHVQNHRPTPEHRETVETVAEAAALVKQSQRRKPRPPKSK